MIYKECTGVDDITDNESFMKQKYQEAISYEYGVGVEEDLPRAIKIYEVAALRGHQKSNYKLGILYFNGHGLTQDINKSIKYLGKSGNSGCDLSCFTLGWIYDEGILIPKNDEKAEYWYAKSAEKGNGNAQYNLSQLCLQISKKTSNKYYEKKSIEWLELAVKNGHPLAQLKLGIHLFNKNDGFESDVRAHDLFKLSANQGDINALYQLGLMYLCGHGVELNLKLALDFLNKAKDAGNIKAKIKVGDIYCNLHSGIFDCETTTGSDGDIIYDDYVEGNYEGKLSFEQYMDAANKGNIEAQYKAGVSRLNSDPSDEQGMNFLADAAYNNCPEAIYLLSIKEICETTISKDTIAYISEYLGGIAGKGFKKASFLLAKLYWKAYRLGYAENEINTVPNLLMNWVSDIHLTKYVETPTLSSNKSTQELISLAKSGDSKAQFEIGYRYACGYKVSKDIEQAIFWYEKSLEKGDPEVVCHLANIYQYGIGVNRNKDKCNEILQNCKVEYINTNISALNCYASELDYRFGIVNHDKNDSLVNLERAANHGHQGATFELAKLYLSDDSKYLDAIKMLIGVASKNVSEASDCSLAVLAKEYSVNKLNGRRKSINKEYIAPLLDERLNLDISFKQAIYEDMSFLQHLDLCENIFKKYQ
ncbi:hypothetical protein VO69_12850 [Aeromonas salmonicida]|nr:hypothetical protein VO69_12850 [Aeromonas salmonicida]